MNFLRLSEPIDLSGRKILVTGGTGFLGRTLLDYFAESGAAHGGGLSVTALSRTPNQFVERWPSYASLAWLDFVRGDVGDDMTALRGEFTDVIHGAASTHGVADEAEWIDQIVAGTRRTLDWAVAAGAKRFLLLSSGAVYGEQPANLRQIPEDFTGAPSTTRRSSAYGQAKRVAEQLCTAYSKRGKLEAVIARCFALTSPHVPPAGPYAIGNFIRDALAGQPIRIRGSGNAVRTYLYGRDMAHWLTTLLVSGVAGEAYNVGADEAVSMAELAAAVAAELNPGTRVVVEHADTADTLRSVYVPDIAKAHGLGLCVETPLNRAIRLTAEGVAWR